MVAAITRKADRQLLDRYETGAWITNELLNHHPIADVSKLVLECCSGNNAITKVLIDRGITTWANDIDQNVSANSHCDSATVNGWESLSEFGQFSFTVTNPPYDKASEVVQLAYEYSTIGIAMLLRCTWMESTIKGNKAQWLADHPPTQIISLPRFAFSRSPKTGKWGTDSCPTWWFIWRKDGYKPENPIVVVPWQQIKGFSRKPLEQADS